MYSFIWRILPGPVFVKALLSLALALAVVYGLFEYAFPWLDPRLPFNQVGEVGETP
ncbi:MAG: hypothetical protein ACT4QG_12365 [Sporichthyaceae bacterium]